MTDNTVRYDICDREDDPFMESCEDGDWANFADYAALVAERDALRTENEQLQKALSFADHMHRTVKNWQKYGNTTHSSIQACLNAYEKSRNEPSSNP